MEKIKLLTEYFESQRLSLAYTSWGEPSAPLLILVHGALDQKRSWDWTLQRLARTYRVIAYDLRGHGESDWVSDGDYGVMDHVYDLASLVDHLDIDRLTIVGHSLGGNIALRYAGLYPDKIEKIVAIEGLGPSPKMLHERSSQPIDERLREWVGSRRKKSARPPRVMASFEEALGRMTSAHGQLTEEQLEHLTRTGVKTLPDGKVQWAYDPAITARTPSDISHDDFVFLLSRIGCPVWLAYGADSWASNPEKDGRLKYLPTATVTEFDDAGHWLHHDRFEDFIAALEVFLSGAAD